MFANKTWVFIWIIAALLLGLVLGVFFPRDLNPLSQSCQYGGKTYRSGERFPADDGCNSCSCGNGRVACTLMACD